MPIEKWSDRVTIAHVGADPQLSDDLAALLDPGMKSRDIVLDLAAARYLNSSHIARLLKLRKRQLSEGNGLVLCSVDPQVWTAFLVTGLDKVFDFADSLPSALAAVQLAQQQP